MKYFKKKIIVQVDLDKRVKCFCALLHFEDWLSNMFSYLTVNPNTITGLWIYQHFIIKISEAELMGDPIPEFECIFRNPLYRVCLDYKLQESK